MRSSRTSGRFRRCCFEARTRSSSISSSEPTRRRWTGPRKRWRRCSGLVTARRPSDADVGRNADRLVATGGLVGVLDRGREGAAVVVADARVVARVRGVDQRVTRATVTRYRRQWQGVGVERRAVLSLEVQVRRPAVAATAADRDGLAGDHRTRFHDRLAEVFVRDVRAVGVFHLQVDAGLAAGRAVDGDRPRGDRVDGLVVHRDVDRLRCGGRFDAGAVGALAGQGGERSVVAPAPRPLAVPAGPGVVGFGRRRARQDERGHEQRRQRELQYV